MLRSTGLAAAFLAAACFAAPASAYTPESGIWWNPQASGSGVVIELQDDVMVVAPYVGDQNGDAIWYTAVGVLGVNAQGQPQFSAPLDLTEGSQCVGCAYTGLPQVVPGAGGTVTIRFDLNDETHAWLRYGNGPEVSIERFEFYTRRPEDASAPVDITKMLGEWQWVLDMSEDNEDYPFFGDVTVFDDYDFDNVNDGWFYEGCRADDSLVGGCSQSALAFHNASGFYIPSTDVQCIVVLDGTTQANVDQFLLYAVKAGTNHARGEVTLYPDGADPRNYFQNPTRGFRSASRTFVQEGVGPARAAAAPKALSSVVTARERTPGAKVEWGEYTESCLLDPTARKRAEARLVAARKG